MNNKNWVKFRMILWSIVAILLVLILIIGIKGWRGNIFSTNILNRSFSISNMKVVKELKFDNINNIKDIKTDFNASDLIITENNENNIKIIVKCNKTLKNKKYINAEINSDTLSIKDFNNRLSGNIFGMSNGYYLQVEIKIPKSYKENITINNRVGDITFDSDLNLNDLYIYVKTGDIDIDKFSGKGSIESKVGDITCNIENLDGDLRIESKVGDVELYINKNLSFIFEANNSVGDLDIGLKFNNISQSSDSFVGEYGENPVNNINSNVKTGDISIND